MANNLASNLPSIYGSGLEGADESLVLKLGGPGDLVFYLTPDKIECELRAASRRLGTDHGTTSPTLLLFGDTEDPYVWDRALLVSNRKGRALERVSFGG